MVSYMSLLTYCDSSYHLSSADDFILVIPSLRSDDQAFVGNTLKLWNDLPVEIRAAKIVYSSFRLKTSFDK